MSVLSYHKSCNLKPAASARHRRCCRAHPEERVPLQRGPLVQMAVKEKEAAPLPKVTCAVVVGKAREPATVAGDSGRRTGDHAAVYVVGIAALHDVFKSELVRSKRRHADILNRASLS